MPNGPLTPCRHSGCAALLVRPGYCTQHARPTCKVVYDQTTRRTDPRLAQAAAIRNSVRWQRFRKWFRDRHPLCCDPFNEHGEENAQPTAQVHHVQPLTERPDLACVEDNCRPLCTVCHGRVERMERAGKATASLFATADARANDRPPWREAPGGGESLAQSPSHRQASHFPASTKPGISG